MPRSVLYIDTLVATRYSPARPNTSIWCRAAKAQESGVVCLYAQVPDHPEYHDARSAAISSYSCTIAAIVFSLLALFAFDFQDNAALFVSPQYCLENTPGKYPIPF